MNRISQPPSAKPPRPFPAARRRASALITTLLVLVVLSTICVAFMQSMSIERSVARSSANRLQATLAADSALAEAVNRIGGLLKTTPYHGVGYTNLAGQTYTILSGKPDYNTTNPPLSYFLVSGVSSTNPPPTPSATNSTALNFRTSGQSGWLGSSLSNGTLVNRECRASWVYIARDPSLPHQPDPSAPGYNPYVSRYAYWVEDESSKIDLAVAGNSLDSGRFRRSTNSTAPSDVDLGAAPLQNGLPLPTNDSVVNQQVLALRQPSTNVPIDTRYVAQAAAVSTNGADTSRFYTTMAGYSSDLAGTGQRRVNLNAIVTSSLAANEITSDLDDIAFVITGSHLFPGLNNSTDEGLFHDQGATNGPMPNFGSRFYTGTPAARQQIYLKKIAANIRDYIDTDSQPTFIDSTGSVVSGNKPADSWQTSAWPQAIGKEAIPFLQEHAWTGFEESWSGSGTSRTGTIEIDHYFELFNPSTKDYTAPPGTFIKLTNLPTWSAGSFPDLTPPDFELDISGVSFPAGKVTVITTSPSSDPAGLILDPTRLVRIAPDPVNARRFENRQTSEPISGKPGFQRDPSGRNGSSASDFSTRFLLGSSNGILEAHPALGFSSSGSTLWNFKGENVGNRTRFVYSTSLRGNDAASRSGDPRSLSEQLNFQTFNSSNGENTRFYGNIQGNAIPGNSTLGRAALNFIQPNKTTPPGIWGDYTPAFADTAATAYAVIADAPMASIGELGHIYDPGGRQQDGTLTIDGARGGGRTLKIGQPDDLISTAARFSPLWQNAAWRLTDIFGVDQDATKKVLDPVSRGKLNINSVARDGGTVLRALLRRFTFLASPDSDPSTASKPLSEAEIQNLIASIQSYLSANGPMLERGELSQISFFSGAATNNSSAGTQPVRTTADRGREELFRRMIEMVTTRSASFSIFAVGEAVQESPSGQIKATSRSTQGVVFRFDPKFPTDLRAQPTSYSATRLYEIP